MARDQRLYGNIKPSELHQGEAFHNEDPYIDREFELKGTGYERDLDRSIDHGRDFASQEFRFDDYRTSGQGSNHTWVTEIGGASQEDRNPYSKQNFSGKGPKGWRRSDESLREDVCSLLFESPDVDASEMEVEVKLGHVYLRGKASDRWTKKEAERCVEHVPGVIDVINELKIA